MDRKANAQMESDTARGLTKREFLKLGGLGALSLLSIAASLGACGARKKPKNWAWLSEDRFPSRDAWGRMFDKMKRHGVDAALVLAKPDTIRTLVPWRAKQGSSFTTGSSPSCAATRTFARIIPTGSW
jgi:hypothetical protein